MVTRLKPAPPFGEGWGRYFKSCLVVFMSLTVSCAFVKGVTKNPASRSTVYGKEEEIIAALKTALESHHYTLESSEPKEGKLTARGGNEAAAGEEGYKGYLLTITLTPNRYGGTKLTFERALLVEFPEGKGKNKKLKGNLPKQEITPTANDEALNRDLVRQVTQQVMR